LINKQLISGECILSELHTAYETLRKAGLVSSQYDFSTVWIGKCESYLSVVKHKGSEPSLDALCVLEARIKWFEAVVRGHPILNSRLVCLGELKQQVRDQIAERLSRRLSDGL